MALQRRSAFKRILVDIQLGHRPQRPEERDSQRHPQQRPVAGQDFQVGERLLGDGDGIAGELAQRIGDRQSPDHQAAHPAGRSHADQYGCGKPPTGAAEAAGDVGQPAADRHAGHGGDHRPQADRPVGCRDAVGADDFRYRAQFRRAEQGALRAHQRNHREQQIDVAQQNRRHAERHDQNFRRLKEDDHAAFAESVGQVARRRRQDEIRRDECDGSGGEHVADVVGRDVLLADADHQPAKDIVVDGPQNHRQQQAVEAGRGEAAPIVMSILRRREVFARKLIRAERLRLPGVAHGRPGLIICIRHGGSVEFNAAVAAP